MRKKSTKEEKGFGKRKRWLLLLLIFIVMGITIWTIWFQDRETVLSPDYVPQEIEENAEPIEDEGDANMEQPEGGGAVSLSYQDEVTIDLSDKTALFYFAIPAKSSHDVVLQLVIQDEIIIQSDRIMAGNQVKTLELLEGVEKQLTQGGYNGKIVVLYYDQESGEKAVVNTEIPVTVTVRE